MGLFWKGHGERIAELERLVSVLTARVVKAEATAADCAERAYRYMKKAESRAECGVRAAAAWRARCARRRSSTRTATVSDGVHSCVLGAR